MTSLDTAKGLCKRMGILWESEIQIRTYGEMYSILLLLL